MRRILPGVPRLSACAIGWALVVSVPITQVGAQTPAALGEVADPPLKIWSRPELARIRVLSRAAMPPASPMHRCSLRLPDSVRTTGADHRWEGAAIGAVGLGLPLLLLTAGLCNSDSGTRNCTYPVVLGTLSGVLIGGTVGLFIGSGIPKKTSDVP